MNTEYTDIKKKEVDALTEKVEAFTVHTLNPNWRHRLGLLPKQRQFELKHLTAGNLMRISALMADVDVDLNALSFKDGLANMAQHTPKLIQAIATAIHNDKSEPPAALIDYLTWNMDSREIASAILKVYKMLDVLGFTITIALMKKASLLNQES